MLALVVALHTFAVARADALRERREDGATAVEYALMVALIAVVIVVAVGALGGTLSNRFFSICQSINGNSPCPGAP